jgi:hypothetical protein
MACTKSLGIIENRVTRLKVKGLQLIHINSNMIKKLQIGCGPNLFEGWLNTDLNYNE